MSSAGVWVISCPPDNWGKLPYIWSFRESALNLRCFLQGARPLVKTERLSSGCLSFFNERKINKYKYRNGPKWLQFESITTYLFGFLLVLSDEPFLTKRSKTVVAYYMEFPPDFSSFLLLDWKWVLLLLVWTELHFSRYININIGLKTYLQEW